MRMTLLCSQFLRRRDDLRRGQSLCNRASLPSSFHVRPLVSCLYDAASLACTDASCHLLQAGIRGGDHPEVRQVRMDTCHQTAQAKLHKCESSKSGAVPAAQSYYFGVVLTIAAALSKASPFPSLPTSVGWSGWLSTRTWATSG